MSMAQQESKQDAVSNLASNLQNTRIYQPQQLHGLEEHPEDVLKIKNMSRFTPYESNAIKGFPELGCLRPQLLDACTQVNWVRPSKIQANGLPLILNPDKEGKYRNFIGQAHHGSGKTGTFVLAMLQRIDVEAKKLQCLCICHSRELAIQTFEVARKLAQCMRDARIFLAVPGERFEEPWRSQIAIGTPGSILKLLINPTAEHVKPLSRFLDHFKMIVIDEADELLRHPGDNNRRGRGRGRGRGGRNRFSGNLTDQTRNIISTIENNMRNKENIQSLLFSATFPDHVKKLAGKLAPNPIIITIEKKNVKLDRVLLYEVECEGVPQKFQTLKQLVGLVNVGQVIIFVNSIRGAETLVRNLAQEGAKCSVLHGKLTPKQRDETMDNFRRAETTFLIASNVIARGIDVPAVKLVVNYEIPIDWRRSGVTGNVGETFDSETFMHRVGRTGRFGRKGACINFVHDNESKRRLQDIEGEYALVESMKHFKRHDVEALSKHVEDWVGTGDLKQVEKNKQIDQLQTSEVTVQAQVANTQPSQPPQ